jgi:hypothetical protein
MSRALESLESITYKLNLIDRLHRNYENADKEIPAELLETIDEIEDDLYEEVEKRRENNV